MKSYELMTITKGQLTEEQASQARSSVNTLMTNLGATNLNSQSLGRKKFAYPINAETEGYYDVYNFNLDESKVSELRSKLNFMDTVVRYLLTLTAKKAVEQESNVSKKSE